MPQMKPSYRFRAVIKGHGKPASSAPCPLPSAAANSPNPIITSSERASESEIEREVQQCPIDDGSPSDNSPRNGISFCGNLPPQGSRAMRKLLFIFWVPEALQAQARFSELSYANYPTTRLWVQWKVTAMGREGCFIYHSSALGQPSPTLLRLYPPSSLPPSPRLPFNCHMHTPHSQKGHPPHWIWSVTAIGIVNGVGGEDPREGGLH